MEHNFRVGDRITGTEDNHYVYTGQNKVSIVIETSTDRFRVRLEDRSRDPHIDGYDVDPRLFKLVTPREAIEYKTKGWVIK